jgi:hypothetical protein
MVVSMKSGHMAQIVQHVVSKTGVEEEQHVVSKAGVEERDSIIAIFEEPLPQMTPRVAENISFAQMAQHVLWKNTSFAQITQHVSWLDQFMEPHNTS